MYYTDPGAASQITAAVGRVDRIVEVALGANLQLDLAISRPGTVVACYAAEPSRPGAAGPGLHDRRHRAPVHAALHAAPGGLDQGVADIGTALRAGALTELPEHRFPLEEIVAAHEAVERGVSGKVLVIPG